MLETLSLQVTTHIIMEFNQCGAMNSYGLSFLPLPRSYLYGDSWLCSNDGARDAGKCEVWFLIAAAVKYVSHTILT